MTTSKPFSILAVSAAAVAGVAVYSQPAQALTFTTFTSSAEFATALGSAPLTVEGYEGVPVDTVIPSGGSLDGLVYNFNVAGQGGRVDDNFNSFGNASLAVERDGNLATPDFFFDGESVRVNFPTDIYAVGIFFNSQVAPASSFFTATPVGTAFTGGPTFDNGNFYFAGLISDTPFTVASFGANGSQSGFTLDNLAFTTRQPVPIPTPALLPGLIAMGLGMLRRSKTKAPVENAD
jgi:hypothetical protein